jgi:hypothetical protein
MLVYLLHSASVSCNMWSSRIKYNMRSDLVIVWLLSLLSSIAGIMVSIEWLTSWQSFNSYLSLGFGQGLNERYTRRLIRPTKAHMDRLDQHVSFSWPTIFNIRQKSCTGSQHMSRFWIQKFQTLYPNNLELHAQSTSRFQQITAL